MTITPGGRRKWIIGLGPGLSALQARLLGLLPGKPMSHDNYLSLQVPSVCSEDGLGQLGVEATDMEAVVPYFLGERSQRRHYYQLLKRRRALPTVDTPARGGDPG
ncbi:MAG: hypothetical protein AB2814_09380 [Candidatus Sedimenticola endophacoides]